MDQSYFARHVETISSMRAMVADIQRTIRLTTAIIADTREAILAVDDTLFTDRVPPAE